MLDAGDTGLKKLPSLSLTLSLVGGGEVRSKCLLCNVINAMIEWSLVYYGSMREGVSPCPRKPGKASQKRGHLDCASKACKTERAGREVRAEGASFKKAWNMKGCCDGQF